MLTQTSSSMLLRKAIVDFLSTHPFFGYVGTNVDVIQATGIMEDMVPTAGITPDFKLYYNEGFIQKLNGMGFEKVKMLVAHELLHIVLDHIGRTGTRHKHISNVAQDMVINMILEQNGFKTLTGKEYINTELDSDSSWFDISHMGKGYGIIKIKEVSKKSWERIYEELISQMKDSNEVEEKMGGDGIKFILDQHLHDMMAKMSPEQKQEFMDKVKDVIANASVSSRLAGNTPKGLERYIDNLLNPKVGWQQYLKRYLSQSSDPKNYTYRKPHRKSFSHGVFLPNILKESIQIGLIVDTSGSINNSELGEFYGEVLGITKTYKNLKSTIIFCDHKVNSEYEMQRVTKESLLSLKPKGGGGTDMEIGLDRMKDLKKYKCVIVFTDGYTNLRSEPTKYPFDVFWCISKHGMEETDAKRQFKYGKVIKIE